MEYQTVSRRRFFDFILLKMIGWSVLGIGGVIWFLRVSELRVVGAMILTGFLYCSVLCIIPLLILFLNHRAKSRGVVFNIDRSLGEFCFDRDGILERFRVADIKSVTVSMSPPAYDNRLDFLMWGKYFYTSIELKNGTLLHISCLVWENVFETVPKDLAVSRRKRIFPLLPG